ncbi:hypothetical protein HPP92_027940 [Vanilla planifolia]|uniref:Uncharacterized protein n=1 Tax=Vanilla planifolia TaxID=51239 RepID=A0A835U6S3_VANPL|nr:hypothetical protein HPP92_027940 [Vanilla planifolia]KAG0448359.1 hypothetical protein HPP92_027891 [Vanilla planifolia]
MEKSRSFPSVGYTMGFGDGGDEDGSSAKSKSASYSFNGPTSVRSDPEAKRKRRVASYNSFTMEAKLKSSVRNSFKWIKSKFSDIH